jgi:glycosyltransferase involved in cell wall biosynthesis
VNNKVPVTVILLCKDEVVNLSRTLKVLIEWAEDVVVIDSHSSDGTADFAKTAGARVFQNAYEYPAQQVNWAIDTVSKTAQPWMLVLNADELPDEQLRKEIQKVVTCDNPRAAAYYINFKIIFMGRWIRHGGFYPFLVVRLFKKGQARCEDRKMDEKFIVNGRVDRLKGHVIDENLKGLDYWLTKHCAYSSREAEDFLRRRQGAQGASVAESWTGDYASRKRSMKKLYDRLPLLYRARWYYWYRMWFRLGFLDGSEGRIWHYLQGYWYRYLVDVKIVLMKKEP